MTTTQYPVPIRSDIIAEHDRVWRHIAGPGSWFSGEERVAIAAEARHARFCRLCQERKQALSPAMVEGTHDQVSGLPDELVEVIHHIVTDPGRLSRSWFDRLADDGLDAGRYVETVGVVAHTVSVDTFHRAMGMDLRPLPEPLPGPPTRYRPDCATPGPGWVATIAKENASGPEADLYADMIGANIQRALTLVPDEMRSFFSLVGAQYLPQEWMRDFDTEYRAISHAQIEFLAARISALNQCVY